MNGSVPSPPDDDINMESKEIADPENVVHLLTARETGIKTKKAQEHFRKLAELKAATSEMQETHCQLPPSVRSTFLMSFSFDCTKVASTHGDHKIYISDVKTGKHLHKLEGHPRTPWCVAFHPTSNDILASGCLAGEVRVWDLHGGSEKWKVDNGQVIASLTFHPFLQLLVIATGSTIYFWDWSQPKPTACCSTGTDSERVRFVKFDCFGHRLITGISNNNPSTSSSKNSNGIPYLARLRPSSHSVRDWTPLIELERFQRRERRFEASRIGERENSGSDGEVSRIWRSERSSSSSEAERPNSDSNALGLESLLGSERSPSGLSPITTPSAGGLSPITPPGTGGSSPISPSPYSPISSPGAEPPPLVDSDGSSSPPDDESLNHASSYADAFARALSENMRSRFEDWDVTEPRSESSSSSAFTQSTTFESSGRSDQSEEQNPQNELLRLQRELQNLENSENLQAEIPESPESPTPEGQENEYSGSGDLWITFLRLRSICTALERRLLLHYRMQRSRDSEAGSQSSSEERLPRYPEFPDFTPFVQDRGSFNLDVENRNLYASLISMLARIRTTLRFSTLSLTAVRDRINQIRIRISEILERLRNVAGYRLRLTNLRRQIFEEMTLQLTGQMERILHDENLQANRNAVLTRLLPSDQASGDSDSETRSVNILDADTRPVSTIDTDTRPINTMDTDTTRVTAMDTDAASANTMDTDAADVSSASHSNEGRSSSNFPTSTSRYGDYVSRRRFNPILTLQRNFRRNSPHPHISVANRLVETSLRRVRSRPQREVTQLGQSRSDNSSGSNFRPVPRLVLAARRRNAVTYPEPPAPEPTTSQPSESIDAELMGGPTTHILTLAGIYDEVSDDSSDEDGRPHSPPFLIYSPNYYSVINGSSNSSGLTDANQTHRIQSWNFSPCNIPTIYDASANIVVKRCMIHNDASVDISQDGEKLVALVPPEDNNFNHLLFGVYSLRPNDLGRLLCAWGYVSNAISVSFSPLAQYVVVGLASSRPIFTNPEKEAVAQIVKIQPKGKTYEANHVRSLTQVINNENRFQQVSLNSVRWLPEPGEGLAYATNRGCLCICKPTAPMFLKKCKSHQSNSLQSTSISLGLPFPGRSGFPSAGTQTSAPATNTTGTQTFSVDRSGSNGLH